MNELDLELYSIVGKMFREIREQKGYTLEAGANYLNITPKSLQRYECGERKIKISTIKMLCEFYNINCSAFMKEAKIRFVSDTVPLNKIKSEKPKPDSRLQKIIDCYNTSDNIGKEMLAEQAEFLQSKHPEPRINEKAM